LAFSFGFCCNLKVLLVLSILNKILALFKKKNLKLTMVK
jgi:hypothetical protein